MTKSPHKGLRWGGVVFSATLFGYLLALGCGSAAPSGGGSTPVPIEMSFPSSLAISVSEATGTANLAVPVGKGLATDLATALPGTTQVDQSLHVVEDNMSHLDAILTLLKDVKAQTTQSLGGTVTTYTWTTAAGTTGSLDFAAKDFPAFSAQSLTSIDCSTACSGHAGAYPICVTAKLNGKRIWFGKFTKLPEGSGKGAGCFRTVSALSCATESACTEAETYLVSGVWDYTDSTNLKLELYTTTAAADANGFIFPSAHSYITDEASDGVRKITVNTTASTSKSDAEGTASAVVRNVTGTNKVYVNTLTLSGSAGTASLLETCLETTTGNTTSGCTAVSATVLTAATAGDVGISTTILASDGASTADTTPPTGDAFSPADGATAQEPSATISVTFSEAMDQTATAAAVSVTTNPRVAASASWSTDGRTLTLTPTTHLRLGSRQYAITVGEGAKDQAGNTVQSSVTKRFTTRDPSTTTIATGTDTQEVSTGGQPGLVAASNGALHACWVEQSANDLYYSQCSGSCTTATNWTSVAIDTGNINNANCAIALDSNSGVHIVFGSTRFLRYRSCTSGCTSAVNWSAAITIDGVGATTAGPALVIDSSNVLHVAVPGANYLLRYVTCATGCTTATNWTAAAVDERTNAGTHLSIALFGSTINIAYEDAVNQQLRFATCNRTCTTASNWTTAAVDTEAGVGRQPILLIDSAGRFHVIQRVVGRADDLRYSTCGSSCTTAGNWSHGAFATSETIGGTPNHACAIDSSNAVHCSAFNNSNDTNAGLLYFLCEGTCTAAANWRKVTVASGIQTGSTSAVAIGPRNKVHLLYTATDSSTDTTGDLKYAD